MFSFFASNFIFEAHSDNNSLEIEGLMQCVSIIFREYVIVSS